MKIRTDFVTNSSSCSYTCWKVESKELAEYVKQFLNGNKDYDGTYFPIEITVEGDIVSCEDEAGDNIDGVYAFRGYTNVSRWYYSDIKKNIKKWKNYLKTNLMKMTMMRFMMIE